MAFRTDFDRLLYSCCICCVYRQPDAHYNIFEYQSSVYGNNVLFNEYP